MTYNPDVIKNDEKAIFAAEEKFLGALSVSEDKVELGKLIYKIIR